MRLSDVSVKYRVRQHPDVTALQGVSCTLARGEVVGVLGRSGSGKSTLGGLLARTLPVAADLTGGEVEWAQPEERRRVASVPQSPSSVFSPFLRCGEQVKDVLRAYGEPAGTVEERVRALFLAAGLGAQRRAEMAWPHELSGGELQRVAVARALAKNPVLLVADEATSALDPINSSLLISRLKALPRERGVTILWITHEPGELLGFADRILTMDNGRLVEQATQLDFAAGRTGRLTAELVEAAR